MILFITSVINMDMVFAEEVKARVEKGQSLSRIARELCPNLEYKKKKIISTIRKVYGDEFLKKHIATLGYSGYTINIDPSFVEQVRERIERGESLEIISENLCPDTFYKREKIIYTARKFLPQEFLEKHAETFGYTIRKRKPPLMDRADNQLKLFGFGKRARKTYLSYLEDFLKCTGKKPRAITKADIENYCKDKHIHVAYFLLMFYHKILPKITLKKFTVINRESVLANLETKEIKTFLKERNGTDRFYCLRTNTMLSICKVDTCSYFGTCNPGGVQDKGDLVQEALKPSFAEVTPANREVFPLP
jgi:hypothetical protein